jgi:DNA-binding NarL/FixJ family response regulator
MHNVIISCNPLLAFGLNALIEANFPAWKISTASCIQEALKQKRGSNKQSATSVKPDLLLLEQADLESLIAYQRGMSSSEIPAIIVFDVDNQTAIDLCRKCDVHGCVLKNAPISCIIEAIQALASRHRHLPAMKKHTPLPSSSFTDRQKELIDLLLQGYSNKKMAHSLNLSYGTIKNYMFILMRQMSVRSRLELAMKLRENRYQIPGASLTKIDSN